MFFLMWCEYIYFFLLFMFLPLNRHVITALTVQPFEANSVCDYGLTLILFSCWTINDGRANANQMEWHVAVVVVMQFHCAFNFKWIPNSVTSKVPLDHHTCPPVFFMMGTINVETIHSEAVDLDVSSAAEVTLGAVLLWASFVVVLDRFCEWTWGHIQTFCNFPHCLTFISRSSND